jgi:hypothetical protein
MYWNRHISKLRERGLKVVYKMSEKMFRTLLHGNGDNKGYGTPKAVIEDYLIKLCGIKNVTAIKVV